MRRLPLPGHPVLRRLPGDATAGQRQRRPEPQTREHDGRLAGRCALRQGPAGIGLLGQGRRGGLAAQRKGRQGLEGVREDRSGVRRHAAAGGLSGSRPRGKRIRPSKSTWEAQADFESGIQAFIIQRDGKDLAQVPEKPLGKFGRPLFQAMSYHDTPERPVPEMRFIDPSPPPGARHAYRVIVVNSVGLRSQPSSPATAP